MAPTILIKFCGFIAHSKPNNMTLSAFPKEIPETKKIVFNFPSVASPNVASKPTDQSRSNSISRVPLQISLARFFFDLPLKVRVVYLRNKQTDSVTNMEFYKHVHYCFCYIKSAGEAANKVLLSVVWNPLLIEINLSQITTLEIKHGKVCAVCPYLLFHFNFFTWFSHNRLFEIISCHIIFNIFLRHLLINTRNLFSIIELHEGSFISYWVRSFTYALCRAAYATSCSCHAPKLYDSGSGTVCPGYEVLFQQNVGITLFLALWICASIMT